MSKCAYGSPNINPDRIDMKVIEDILKSGWVCIGKYVEEFENYFKERYGVKHAIACNNATNGLIIAIKAAGWRNKRVAVPAFTWPSTVYAIECNQGNVPVFCDIDRDTWMISPSGEYDTVVAVDVFGVESYVKTDKPVIYDAAHGFDLPNLGDRGLAEVVSFSFTKLVTAMEGGMILTNDDDLAKVAKELRRLSGRLEEINAYVALKSIEEYETGWRELRESIVYKYMTDLDNFYTMQHGESNNYSVFTIMFETQHTRNAVLSALSKNDIETKVYYEPIIDGLPNTDYVFSRVISLPVHHKMIDIQDEIIRIVNEAVKNNGMSPGKNYLTNVLRKGA